MNSTHREISGYSSYQYCLAIFIAPLGLFALASFSAERRLKGIGVRKVMGASESGLIFMMYKEFLTPIAISFVMASPLAYYFFTQWLNRFAYHVDLSVMTFLLAVAFITVIALLAVGYQSITVTRTNPVKVLRSE